VDGSVDSTAAEERRIGGVDDGVNPELGDVAAEDFELERVIHFERVALHWMPEASGQVSSDIHTAFMLRSQ
jgi:hypothetical protein